MTSKTLAAAIGLFFFCIGTGYFFPTTVQVLTVRGESMAPTLRPSTYVLASPLGADDVLSNGSIVIFHVPDVSDRHLIKRIVGTSGDVVAMRAGQMYVNGVHYDEPYVQESLAQMTGNGPPAAWHYAHVMKTDHAYRPTGADWGPIRVPGGRYFVLGDNRDSSGDSRRWGFVTRDNIEARVIYSVPFFEDR